MVQKWSECSAAVLVHISHVLQMTFNGNIVADEMGELELPEVLMAWVGDWAALRCVSFVRARAASLLGVEKLEDLQTSKKFKALNSVVIEQKQVQQVFQKESLVH